MVRVLDFLHPSWSSKSESGSCSLVALFSGEVARPRHPYGCREVTALILHRVLVQDNLGKKRGTAIIT